MIPSPTSGLVDDDILDPGHACGDANSEKVSDPSCRVVRSIATSKVAAWRSDDLAHLPPSDVRSSPTAAPRGFAEPQESRRRHKRLRGHRSHPSGSLRGHTLAETGVMLLLPRQDLRGHRAALGAAEVVSDATHYSPQRLVTRDPGSIYTQRGDTPNYPWALRSALQCKYPFTRASKKSQDSNRRH